jgi:hypothetical protein
MMEFGIKSTGELIRFIRLALTVCFLVWQKLFVGINPYADEIVVNILRRLSS